MGFILEYANTSLYPSGDLGFVVMMCWWAFCYRAKQHHKQNWRFATLRQTEKGFFSEYISRECISGIFQFNQAYRRVNPEAKSFLESRNICYSMVQKATRVNSTYAKITIEMRYEMLLEQTKRDLDKPSSHASCLCYSNVSITLVRTSGGGCQRKIWFQHISSLDWCDKRRERERGRESWVGFIDVCEVEANATSVCQLLL